MLDLCPVNFKTACEFIKSHHRHHLPPQGWKFGIGVMDGEKLVGIITIGRPVARALDDGFVLEVTRCCTDGTKDACSKLYSAAWRAAKAMGYKKLITYTLISEPGTSLKAAGFKTLYEVKGRDWSCPSRPRDDKHPTCDKLFWEIT